MDHYLKENSFCGLYFSENTHGLCAGFAVIGPLGMDGFVCEIAADVSHPYATLDRVLHLLFVASAHKIVIGASSLKLFESLKHHFESFDALYDPTHFTAEETNGLLEGIFSLRSLLSPLEHLGLEESPLAAAALSLLAAHTKESRFLPFSSPYLLATSGLLQMGNNPLEQLEMVSHNTRDITISKLLLGMKTDMGRRLGRFRLGLPILDTFELNNRFEWIEKVSPHTDYLDEALTHVDEIAQDWSLVRIHDAAAENGEWLCQAIERVALVSDYLRMHKVDLPFCEAVELRDWCREFWNQYHRPQWLRGQNGFIASVLANVAKLDVAVTSARMASRYALCRPLLVQTKKDEHFLQAMGLRHLLIEAQGIEYVPNDIVMGNRDYLDLPYPDTVMLDSRVHDGAEISGVLLYGINSSGKSSLMKSIGIAVVLAQAGFYVPARAMKFSPFEALYTRILSRDNVVKSLSTFGVEMLELNTIFHKATPKTLVLGDEISHGTETLSAVAIVASTIIELAQKNVMFILTTHLHQLSMIKELSFLRQVVSLHLSVHYDEGQDALVYDRRLRAGQGSSVYGLEFAQSLHMHSNFLSNAARLREDLAKEYDVLELSHKKEYIKRYNQVIACECVICGALITHRALPSTGREHHHLIPLCDRHARQIAEGKINVTRIIMTPQGLRLEYETQLQG